MALAPLLQSPEQQFCDANGKPYAGGTLATYVTGTATPKATWIDSGQVALNTNPVTLDSAGRCLLFGDGLYRLILHDAAGNLIWDQPASTLVSAAMAPVVIAPTIAAAQALLGIDPNVAAEIAAEAAARNAAIAVETVRALAAEAALGVRITGIALTPGPAGPAGPTGPAGAGATGGSMRAGITMTDAFGHLTVTFAPAFATACVAVVPAYDSQALGGLIGISIGSLTMSASSFSAMIVDADANPVVSTNIPWFAVGY